MAQEVTELLRTLEFKPVDDPIMGGKSASTATKVGGQWIFEGNVSFENNGGFCSTRAEASLDCSRFSSLELMCIGDGKIYKVNLRVAGQRCLHQYVFCSVAGLPQIVHIPFNKLVASFKGKPTPQYVFDPALVDSIGFTIARQEGHFKLKLLWLFFS